MSSSRRTFLPGKTQASKQRAGQTASGEVPTRVRVRAVAVVRRMRGASQPFLIQCDDAGTYVVKFQNNPQDVRVLANEMLVASLAYLIGLPIPRVAFVDVPRQLVANSTQLAFEIGSRRVACVPGLQFGSRFPGPPDQTLVVDFLPDPLLRRVSNLQPAFLGAFVLDKWSCNCDGRQVIFHRPTENREGSPYSALLIDHGYCFNDGEWNFPDSPIRSLYPRRLVYESVKGLGSFEPFLSRVENIESSQLEDCVRAVPLEWCGEEPERLVRLMERLYERRRRLRQAIIDAKNSSLRPFPNWE